MANPIKKLRMISTVPRRNNQLEPLNTGNMTTRSTSASPVATAAAIQAMPAKKTAIGSHILEIIQPHPESPVI
jgi:hypothetical protein